MLVGSLHAQNTGSEKMAIEMLKRFYIEYGTIWTTKYPNSKVFNYKLDSLAKQYCTSILRIRAKKALAGDYGQDLLSNDLMSPKLNENFQVEKDPKNSNVYIVSFVATNMNASLKYVKQKVVLHVSVVKENDKYKISNVR